MKGKCWNCKKPTAPCTRIVHFKGCQHLCKACKRKLNTVDKLINAARKNLV